jgi:uncharacterized protein YndB with AHSA1/START domain
MSIDVTVDATIARMPEDVFARIADIEAWPRWLIASGITLVRRTTTGPVREGEHFVVQQRAAGRTGTFDAVARVVDPPTRFVVEGRDPDGVSIAIDATVAAADETSALRWSIRIGLPFRYRIFESMARPQVERAARLDIERLRQDLGAA